MFKRFFAFGCSFTQHVWPTWADIISWDLDIPCQNWGMGGLGNVGIFHRMVECDLTNNFNADDLIITLWSTWSREDRYLKNTWEAHGNVFNNHLYNKNFLSNYWSMENDIIKNSTAIIATNKMFDLNFQGHIQTPATFETNEKMFSEQETRLLNFYKQHFSSDNIFDTTFVSEYNAILQDSHPDLLQHLTYVNEKIYPKLGLKLKPETVTLCNNLHVDILELFKTRVNRNHTLSAVKSIIDQKYNVPFEIKRNIYGF
jgi:hypothetical protein